MSTDTQFQSLLSAGLVLCAIGAMLTYAVDADPEWIDLSVVGTIGLTLGVGCLIVAVVAAFLAAGRGAYQQEEP